MEKEEYEAQIKALKEEIELLKKKQTYEIKRQKYGLNWIDVPEAFEKDSENKIPVLEEVKDKSIKNDDGKPTHILIEGDNYHALQCLNYTHKGKIDVIYIDPPYNTGNEFVYKDARYLDKYPDGSLVDTNHPLKHSYWLSFMEKRLKLAKNLLSKKGVIFISIDDNEQANLKLLCDSIFGEKNYESIIWKKKGGAGNTEKILGCLTEYILCFFNEKKSGIFNFQKLDRSYKYKDDIGFYNLEGIEKTNSGTYARPTMLFDIIDPVSGKHFRPSVGMRWTVGESSVAGMIKENKLYFDYKKNKVYRIKRENDYEQSKNVYYNLFDDCGSLSYAKDELEKLNFDREKFDTPKPTLLLNRILTIASNSSSTILDFFAGSGTTLHATMKLNEEDGGNRQCILVQLNENNICEEVTYERNRRVMQGYTNSKGEQIPGLGNSLKYYKTAFIGQNNCKNANDDDRTELAKKAGCLLSLGENTLDEICSTEYYQLFTGSKEATAVYFTDDYEKFDEFKEKVAELAPKFKKTFVYIFAWSSADDFAYEFEDIPNIQIKAIPLPILEIYKSIYNA